MLLPGAPAPPWSRENGKNGIVELTFSDMMTVADTDHLPLPLYAMMSDFLTFTCRRRETNPFGKEEGVFLCVHEVILWPALSIVAAIKMRPHKITQPGWCSEVLKERAHGLGCQNDI